MFSDGVHAFLNHKKCSALQKGMKKLLARWKVPEGKIKALGTEMVSKAHTSLKEIERLQTDIVERNKRLEILTQYIMYIT